MGNVLLYNYATCTQNDQMAGAQPPNNQLGAALRHFQETSHLAGMCVEQPLGGFETFQAIFEPRRRSKIHAVTAT